MMGKDFSASGKKVLEIAQNKTLELKHNILGTEHLLLGLIIEEDGIAGKILRKRGLTEEDILSGIKAIVGEGTVQTNHIMISPRTKNIFEMAGKYASQFGYDFIETEHILVGILAEGEGIASIILKGFGIDIDIIQNDIQETFIEGQSESPYNATETKNESSLKNL